MKLSLSPLSGVVIGVFATWSCALADVRIGSVIQKEYNGALGLRIGAASDRLYSDRDIFSDEKVTTPSGGSTVLLFQDGIQLQLGHSSEVVLNRSGASQGGALVFAPGLYRLIGGGGTSEVGLQLQTSLGTLASAIERTPSQAGVTLRA